ncbi:predicted protein [Postia placenta Mad-698-R]|nr:predicted protein [Postia placenta Mad-698-R]
MSKLPPHLVLAAREIFDALRTSRTEGILIGGAAAMIHGSTRETKDLDINTTSLNFQEPLGAKPVQIREGSSATRLKLTYMGPDKAVSCDIASDHAQRMPMLLQYTSEYQGIRYASAPLLIVDKLLAFTERGSSNYKKRGNDLIDILFLANKMVNNKECVSQELRELFLRNETLHAFYTRLEIDGEVDAREAAEVFFPQLGLGSE